MEDYQNRINHWLRSRQDLLVAMFEIDQIPTKELNTHKNQEMIHHFCDCLIDYISAGHFEIYHKMLECIDGKSSLSLDHAHSLLNQIQHSTDMAVNFNDHFEHIKPGKLDQLFRQRLSDLAESLAERFEMEDILFDEFSAQVSKSLSA